MNDLWTEVGYVSLNKQGETLCGDRVETSGGGEEDVTLVLADGLGSGVKANILATLTSKIVCTLASGGLPIEECVSAIASTLPVCSVKPRSSPRSRASSERSSAMMSSAPASASCAVGTSFSGFT